MGPVLETKLCKKHGLELRPKQRNCDECNREANRKYWASLRGGVLEKKIEQTFCKPRGKGFVYFIQADIGNEIKIGFSKSPIKRLHQLQTAATRPLHLLAVMEGGHDLEHALHQRYAQHRTVGEWFKPAPEIIELIRQHATMDGELQYPSKTSCGIGQLSA